MEEVDKILIITLNQLGCEFEKSVSDFTVADVILAVSKCLRAIDGESKVQTLPPNMAQRFRMASAIAQSIKDVGYKGDIGYQSLLYPNDVDLRKILMFLIEKLPKDTATVSDEPINKASLLHQEVRRKLRKALTQAWLPPHCRSIVRSYASRASVLDKSRPFISKPIGSSVDLSEGEKIYYEKYRRRVSRILSNKNLIPSLLNHHAVHLEYDRILPAKLEKETTELPKLEPLYREDATEIARPIHRVERQSLLSALGSHKQLMNIQDPEKETRTDSSSASVGIIDEEGGVTLRQKEVSDLSSKIEECLNIIESTKSSLSKVEEELVLADKAKEEKAIELKLKLLPTSEVNIQKLQAAIKNSEGKMSRLQQQWEGHKEPLDDQLQKLNKDISGRKGTKDQIRIKMSNLREKMRTMVQEAARKEAVLAQLKIQCESMNKDINRSVYTKRIIDISAKVRKQKEEIERVLVDTRTIQKEINSLSGKLGRTFTVVESVAFKEAGSNERARQVYRAVAAVHEGCGELVDIIRDTGSIQREISDLKEQVDLEKTKKVEETLEQCKTDLSQLKKENSALKQQLL